MVLPTIVPTGFQGNYTDFFQAKVERDGSVRRAQGAVTVPAGTTSGTVIGLLPFTSGFSFAGLGGYNLYTADLDTASSVTLNFGIAYQDTSAGTDNLDAIASASTAPQAGGFVAPDEIDYLTVVSTGNGWVTVQTGGATTGTAGDVTFNIPFAYDQPEN